jgi:GAF domain
MAVAQQLSVAEKSGMGPDLRPDFDRDRTFEEITRSALHATAASGAALILTDGTVMSCRACSGRLAPPVGTRLNTSTGFTATCVQTAQVIRCDNTASDPRVDGTSCIQLGIHSILAVPVFDGEKVAGVLEVLSNEPGKFTDRHATALKLLARLVETLVNYASRADAASASVKSKPHGAAAPDAPSPNVAREKAEKVEKKDQPTIMCLSCGHPNPDSSRFCNRCGVILLANFDPPEPVADENLPVKPEAANEEGLKEIYSLIAGSAGRPTWNEIYAKLLANMQSTSAQSKPPSPTNHDPARPDVAKKDNGVVKVGSSQGTNDLKSRIGAAVRNNLWL